MDTQKLIKIMLAGANPTSLNPIKVAEEFLEIESLLLNNNEYKGLFEIQVCLEATASAMIQALIKFKPDIFHFSGHGLAHPDGPLRDLILTKQSKEPYRLGEDNWARLFESLRSPLKAIILNACYSNTIGQRLKQYSDAVISTKYPIEDPLAIELSKTFYLRYADGILRSEPEPIPFAFQMAKEAAENSGDLILHYEPLEKIKIHGDILEKVDRTASILLEYPGHLNTSSPIHIPRKITETLLSWIEAPLKPEKNKNSRIAMLVGNAGVGKTTVMRDLLGQLKSKAIPTFVLKADAEAWTSFEDLQQKIGLNQPVLEAIKLLANEHEQVVVLIDQIDALSQSYSIEREQLLLYRKLIADLTYSIPNLRIVVSCREFDLAFDPNLSNLRPGKTEKLGNFSMEDITKVFAESSVDIASVPERYLSFLGKPLHLELFLRVYSEVFDFEMGASLGQLYRELEKKLKAETSRNRNPHDIQKCLSEFISESKREKKLAVSQYRLNLGPTHDYLLSQGIFVSQKGKIRLFHQSFHDYQLARLFLKENENFREFIVSQHQGLLVRQTVKIVLSYLKETDENRYYEELEGFLSSPEVSHHLIFLVLRWIAREERVFQREKEIIQNWILSTDLARSQFLEAVNSNEWLEFLVESEELNEFLSPEPTNPSTAGTPNLPQDERTFLSLLLRHLNSHTQYVLDLFPRIKQERFRKQFLQRFGYNFNDWKSLAIIRFIDKYLEDIPSERDWTPHYLKEILQVDPRQAARWFKRLFDKRMQKRIEAYNSAKKQSPESADLLRRKIAPFNRSHAEFLKEMIEKNEEIGLRLGFEVLESLLEENEVVDEANIRQLHRDTLFTGIVSFDPENPDSLYDYQRCWIEIHTKLTELAQNQPQSFRKWLQRIHSTQWEAMYTLLPISFSKNVKEFSQEILEFFRFLIQKGAMEYQNNLTFYSKPLLGQVIAYWTDREQAEILGFLVAFRPEGEKNVLKWRGKKEHPGRWSGQTAFSFLRHVSKDILDKYDEVRKGWKALNRKFKDEPEEKPIGRIPLSSFGAPLEESAYEKMNDSAWINSFIKIQGRFKDWESHKGGEIEHGQAFERLVSENPYRFVSLIDKIIDDDRIPVSYKNAGLKGLEKARFKPAQYLRSFKRLMRLEMNSEQTLYLCWGARYLLNLPEMDREVFDKMADFAIHHPDPDGSRFSSTGNMNTAINSVRGVALEWLLKSSKYPRFHFKIKELLPRFQEETNIACRTLLAAHSVHLERIDKDLAVDFFLGLKRGNLDFTPDAAIFSLQYFIHHSFDRLIPYFEWTLEKHPQNGNTGALLTAAWFHEYEGSNRLLDLAIDRLETMGTDIIRTANDYILRGDAFKVRKGVDLYLKILDQTAVGKQRFLFNLYHQLDPRYFLDFFAVISKLLEISKAYQGSDWLFKFLNKCVQYHPLKMMQLLEKMDLDIDENFGLNLYPQLYTDLLVGTYYSILNQKPNRTDLLDRCMELFNQTLELPDFRRVSEEVLVRLDVE